MKNNQSFSDTYARAFVFGASRAPTRKVASDGRPVNAALAAVGAIRAIDESKARLAARQVISISADKLAADGGIGDVVSKGIESGRQVMGDKEALKGIGKGAAIGAGAGGLLAALGLHFRRDPNKAKAGLKEYLRAAAMGALGGGVVGAGVSTGMEMNKKGQAGQNPGKPSPGEDPLNFRNAYPEQTKEKVPSLTKDPAGLGNWLLAGKGAPGVAKEKAEREANEAKEQAETQAGIEAAFPSPTGKLQIQPSRVKETGFPMEGADHTGEHDIQTQAPFGVRDGVRAIIEGYKGMPIGSAAS